MSSMSCWSIVLPLSQCQQMFPSCSLQETLQGHEEAPESLVGQAPKVGHLPSCVEAGICHISPLIVVSNYRELKGIVICHLYNAILKKHIFVISYPPFLLSFQVLLLYKSGHLIIVIQQYLLCCHGSWDQGGC